MRCTLILLLVLAVAPLAHAGERGVFLTVDEALALAFDDAEVEKETCYLTEEQHTEARRLAKCDLASKVARPYVARDADGEVVGVAYFETHRVRSLTETLMTVVAPDGRVERVEVLAFREPRRYMPRAGFYAQLQGRALDDELAIGRGVRCVTGATLSCHAAVDSARRALALHEVLFPAPAPEPEPQPVPIP